MSNNMTKVELSDRVEESYMGYAMSTIVDRALPDVRDGLLPIHRRILYAMYKAGITKDKERAKSTSPVSETMKIHSHGDASIYSSLALLTEQNETLLHPFIDGEGSFGKVYSTDSPSQMRYTFCRLNKFSEEMFKGINKNVVKMIGQGKEIQPIVLPTLYPNILVKPNTAVAVGEACDFGSFPLEEVCNTTIAYIKDKSIVLTDYLTPDFSTGAYLIYDKKQLESIYNTGKGSVRLRAKYNYDEVNSCIEISEIPYSTTVERIIQEVFKKVDKFKEILDIRDESGFDKLTNKEGLKITIDVRKNTDILNLMNRLYKETSLENSFSFNMNCLVDFEPKVLGVKSILDEWLKFRKECIQNSMQFDIEKKSKELHILIGLEKILLNIDKAIEIIRFSHNPLEVLKNYFDIDDIQAENILKTSLRNINSIYIEKQIKDISKLKEEVLCLKNNIDNDDYINNIIIEDLIRIRDNYKKPRLTEIISKEDVVPISKEEVIEDYNCRIVYSKNYIKKHLKQSKAHKMKDGEEILGDILTTNKSVLLVFTNKCNRYRIPVYKLDIKQPSNIGDYIRGVVDMDKDEYIIKVVSVESAKGYMVFCYDNGKISKIDIKSYMSANVKLANCYSTEATILDMAYIPKDTDVFMASSEGKCLVLNTSCFNSKTTRSSQGNVGIKLQGDLRCVGALIGCNTNEVELVANNGKTKAIKLSDEYDNTRTWIKFLTGKNGNQGSFVLNCRSINSEIDKVIIK